MTEAPDPASTEDGKSATRAQRQSVFLNATLQRFGGEAITKHRVRDLSSGGMRIDQATDLRVGATVLVTIGLLEAIGATIAWVKDEWAGVAFAEQVDAEQARAKTVVPPKTLGLSSREPAAGPTAGWVRDLNSPYRK